MSFGSFYTGSGSGKFIVPLLVSVELSAEPFPLFYSLLASIFKIRMLLAKSREITYEIGSEAFVLTTCGSTTIALRRKES
jgi:hypothetical protein